MLVLRLAAALGDGVLRISSNGMGLLYGCIGERNDGQWQ